MRTLCRCLRSSEEWVQATRKAFPSVLNECPEIGMGKRKGQDTRRKNGRSVGEGLGGAARGGRGRAVRRPPPAGEYAAHLPGCITANAHGHSAPASFSHDYPSAYPLSKLYWCR
ncbi:hypothetical protein EVAR_19197_1 [Eumeta japonica]|uniref:Uncharacterized protein n=1 Tax=Eumeta variegata TaxID=151549 RepID=A0A4C1VD60_EUMVA|nr:hypothetical protein EVAR_19197_1 [Eumeta japonica]